MMRYLVTGAQGFVGRYFISHLLRSQRGAEILGIGRSPRQNSSFTHCIQRRMHPIPAPLPAALDVLAAKRYQYVSLNLDRRDSLLTVLRGFRPDVIVHLASGFRDDSPTSLFKTNVDATIHLLEAVAGARIAPGKIIVGSTAGVYGVPAELPLREDAACNPIDLYSTSKLAAEHASRILGGRYELPVVWARMFNLVGPGEDDRHICGRLAAQAAAILDGQVAPVMQSESLDVTRDVIDVRDAAFALALIAENGTPGLIYNVGSGSETSMHTVLETTLRVAGLADGVTVRQKPMERADIPRHFASADRVRALGFNCQYDLRRSIADLLDYYRSQVNVANVSEMVDAGHSRRCQ